MSACTPTSDAAEGSGSRHLGSNDGGLDLESFSLALLAVIGRVMDDADQVDVARAAQSRVALESVFGKNRSASALQNWR